MANGRFYHTLHLPMETQMAWVGEEIKNIVDLTNIKDIVESKLPTLRGKNYNICLV